MLRSQHANETEEKNSEVTVEELLGKTSQSDAEKDLYDKQLFFAAQLLHAELEEQTVKKTPATADAR